MFNENFFKKLEEKTNVSKESIMGLAEKLQKNNLKDENTLRDVIHQLSNMSGRVITKEQEDKIIGAVVNDEVPTDLDKYV